MRRRRRTDARQRKEHWQGRTESWEVTLIEVTILAFRKILQAVRGGRWAGG